MIGHWRLDPQTSARPGPGHNSLSAIRPDIAGQLRQLDCDPIAGMVRLANDETAPASLRARMFAELATYVAPKLKTMALTGPNGTPLDLPSNVNISLLSDDELQTMINLLRKAGAE